MDNKLTVALVLLAGIALGARWPQVKRCSANCITSTAGALSAGYKSFANKVAGLKRSKARPKAVPAKA